MVKWLVYQLIVWVCIVIVFLVFSPIIVHGQTPVEKPTTAVWDHANFATTQKYELGYFAYPVISGNCNFAATAGANPTQTDDLGKPDTTTGISITASLIARPIGCYGAKVRALDTSGLWSDWSPMSNNFFTRPPAPTNPAVK
jgi:hypothetical protein